MKMIYVLPGTDMAFESWEDCQAFMERCKEHPAVYDEVFPEDFRQFIIWNKDNEIPMINPCDYCIAYRDYPADEHGDSMACKECHYKKLLDEKNEKTS